MNLSSSKYSSYTSPHWRCPSHELLDILCRIYVQQLYEAGDRRLGLRHDIIGCIFLPKETNYL